ncbi:putative methionine-tRNA ligase-like, partial [Trifolium medium]|nr:putative methionine-tRNA ligase-like [Trifolium medium]
VNLKQGLKIAMTISREGNAYLQQTAFWRLYKENLSLCSLVMKTAAGIVYLLACLLEPFMPSFTLEVFKQLNLSAETHLSLSDLDRVKRPWDILSAGHKIGTPKALFRELKDEEMEFYMNKYAGSQADRIIRAKAEQMKKIKVSGIIFYPVF